MSTFKQLQDDCLEHGFNETKYRAEFKKWLNEAADRIARQVNIPALYAVTNFPWAAGENRSELPEDYARRVEVADNTNPDVWRLLSEMSLSDFDMLAETPGSPSDYTMIGGHLYLYPTPDLDVTIGLSYYRLPERMTEDDEISEIPTDYHFLLTYWALYRAFSRENDMEQGSYWKNEWLTEIEKLKGEMNYEGQTQANQVPGTFEDSPLLPGNLWY